MYFVYVIRSVSSGRIYIGQTEDLAARLRRHNKDLPVKSKSFTFKNCGPWELVYKEEYETRKLALEREKSLKSHRGRDWLKEKLMNYGPVAQPG